MTYFSDDAIAKLAEEFVLLQGRYEALLIAYNNHNYRVAKSAEHAQHGFLRRLGTLLRCVHNTYRILPPERGDHPPSREDRLDATINIQAFVFNIFGAINNLAWLWVTEIGLKKEDGSQIASNWAGFGPKNTFLRQSLSPSLQEYLASLDGWFAQLESFRHALAHRVPLYIPPYIVLTASEAEWRSLEQEITRAALRGDSKAKDTLTERQMKLCKFRPWMVPSLFEGQNPIVFHAQLIADFKTVEELGLKLLPELP